MSNNTHNTPKTRLPGTVYLVGAGPGDPELASIKALRLIQSADVIVFDRLANPALLAHAKPNATLIDAGKLPDRHKLTQDEINATLAEHAQANPIVVRLKGGDPYVFGRGSEEGIYLAQLSIPFESVPGITAAIAAANYAGIPVTHRNVATTLTLITGHEDPTKSETQVDYKPLAALAAAGGTLCFYMGMGRLNDITAQLTTHGLSPDTPAAIIQWGTHPTQRSLKSTIAKVADDVAAAQLSSPAIILIGQVAAVDPQNHLNWFEQRPLFGKTILITRTRHQSSELKQQLELLGANVIEAPTIEITPPTSWDETDSAIRNLNNYDWLILTSVNGVAALAERLAALNLDARALANLKIAAIGDATAAAIQSQLAITPDLIPTRFVAESLAADLIAKEPMSGKRILMLRADIARPALREKLTEAGAQVHDLPAYETKQAQALPPEAVEALRNNQIDWITFTSSSTVTNLHQLLGQEAHLLNQTKLASIGPITTQTLNKLNLTPTTESDPHTIPALINAIILNNEPRTK